MSYDLYFWRERPGIEVDAERLLSELEDTVQFPGIVGVPLDIIRQEFRREFPEVTGGDGSLEWEGHGSYFQVDFTFLTERTVSMIAVSFGYDLLKSPQVIQQLEKVAESLGCRIYDPQKT